MKNEPVFSLRKKILFSLIMTLLLLATLDGFLRIIGFSFNPYRDVQAHQNVPQWSDRGVMQDPTLSWSWTPIPGAKVMIEVRTGAYAVQFNEKGYRSPDFSYNKPAGTIRIVCMGDSCTMGWGVEDRETYCNLLPSLLQKTSQKRIEAINAGVLGHTSFQGLHRLRTKVVGLDPDIVVISYNWNDHLPAINMGGRTLQDKDLPAMTLSRRITMNLAHLRSYQLVEYLVWKATRSTSPPQKVEENRLQNLLVRVSLEDYEKNLEEMIRIAKANGIIPILMSQPRRTKLPPRPELKVYTIMQTSYNNSMRNVAQRNKVKFVNLQSAFSLEKDFEIFLDQAHPTPKGHFIMAKELSAAIQSLPIWQSSTAPRLNMI